MRIMQRESQQKQAVGVSLSQSIRTRADTCALPPVSPEREDELLTSTSDASSLDSLLFAQHGVSASWIYDSAPTMGDDNMMKGTAAVIAVLAGLEAAAEMCTEHVHAHVSDLRDMVQRAALGVTLLASECTTHKALVSENEGLKLENAVLRAEISHLSSLLDDERRAGERASGTLLDKLRTLQHECHLITRAADQAVAQAASGRTAMAAGLQEGAPA